MFLLYINDVNSNILLSIWLFADKCVIYRTIINHENDAIMLQKDVDEIQMGTKVADEI